MPTANGSRDVVNGQTVEYVNRAAVKVSRAVSAASNNATLVQAGPTQLHGFAVNNINAAARYLKLYDKATAPNPAADNALLKLVIPIAAASVVNLAFDAPIAFTLGLGYALVTGISDTDNTGVAASEHVVNLFYS